MDYQDIQELLKRPIAFHRIFADVAGGACGGLFLSQLFYWSPKATDPDGWIHKSGEEWHKETALSRRELEVARRTLRDKGVLQEKKEGLPRRLYFKLNPERLFEVISDALRQGKAKRLAGVAEIAQTGLLHETDLHVTSDKLVCQILQTSSSDLANNLYTEITPEITPEITLENPPYVPPTGGEQEKDQEGGGFASLEEEDKDKESSKGEYGLGASNPLTVNSEAQEEALEQEQVSFDIDHSSASPKAPQRLAKGSDLMNLAQMAADVLTKARRAAEPNRGQSSKPTLRTKSNDADGESQDWECPIPEKYLEFLQYEAERLIRETGCPRVEARDRVIGNWNRHKRKANLKFEDWLAEEKRQNQEPETVERKRPQAVPEFQRMPKQYHEEQLAHYNQVGEDAFCAEDGMNKYWVVFAKQTKLIPHRRTR